MHELARAYGWTEGDVFGLSLRRRLAYRMLLEQEADAALHPGSAETPPR